MSLPPSNARRLLALALISAAGLYLEMVLIRWIAAEVRIFAYMHNLLLVASFLGISLGCYRSERAPSWKRGLASLLLLVAVVADPLRLGVGEIVTQGMALAEDSVIWDTAEPVRNVGRIALAFALTIGIVAATVLALEPIGAAMGRALQSYPRPLPAYTANLLGSLLGTLGFFAMSAASTPPSTWFALAAAMLAPFVLVENPRATPRALLAALLVAPALSLAILAFRRGDDAEHFVVWSPYQKLAVAPVDLPPAPPELAGAETRAGYVITVNSTGYMAALDLSPAHRAKRPDVYPEEALGHYDIPYRVIPKPRRMLIVGAGAGNDVAAALRNGAEEIDAVEIDPEILALGKRLHPERPYDSPRVRAIVDDARSYFRRAEEGSYDLVWFGLLDSHTTGSGLSTLRLDHYVYTLESFTAAKKLLRPDGLIVCTFATMRPWIGDRLSGMLARVFDGTPPISVAVPGDQYCGWGGQSFFAASAPVLARVRENFERSPALAAFFHERETNYAGTTEPTHDDWPYLYLEHRRLPTTHLVVSLLVLAVLAWFGLRGVVRAGGIDWPFFLLGAGFLLMQVLGVSRAALLFGSTWIVTAIVVSGVLTMALLGNLWVSRSSSRALGAPLAGLLVCGGALLLLPLELFSPLPMAAKVALVGAFLAAPVYFSGLIFTRLFRETARKDLALGSNLFGAVAGGLFEQVSFVSGLRALTAFGLAIYVAAVWIALRRARFVP